jgi:hypothetical protein
LPLLGSLAQVSLDNRPDFTGTEANPLITALNQPAATAPLGNTYDPNAYLAALLQNGDSGKNTALIASFLQQQSSAATISLLTSIYNMQDCPPSNLSLETPGAVQSRQGFPAQVLKSMIEQPEALQATTQTNSASFGIEAAEMDFQFQSKPDTSVPEPTPAASTQGTPSTASCDILNLAIHTKTPHYEAIPGSNATESPGSWPQPINVGTTTNGGLSSRHRIPMFGIDGILFPSGTELRPKGHNLLINRPSTLSGRFVIMLVYSVRHCRNQRACLQSLNTDQIMTVIEPCSLVNFETPCGDVSMSCAVRFNSGAASEDSNVINLYKVVIQSPFGHGLTISYSYQSGHLHTAREVVHGMVNSISWFNRAKICTSVSDRLVGKWTFEREASHSDIYENNGDDDMDSDKYNDDDEDSEDDNMDKDKDNDEYDDESYTSRATELIFTAGGRYLCESYPSAAFRRSRDKIKKISGDFEAFQYRGGAVHLVLMDDTMDVRLETITLRENRMAMKENVFVKVVAS